MSNPIITVRHAERAAEANTPAAPRHPRRCAPARLLAGIFCLLMLLCVPWAYYTFDMTGSGGWLAWARASGGDAPWRIYHAAGGCNYPPFVLYLLTGIERARLWLHAPPVSPVSISLVKLPNLLACAAGVPLCRYGLRRAAGEAAARRAAWAYGLCLPLWFNAAVWGQYDAVLTLAMAAAVVALLNGRLLWCGAALGWALSVKAQPVVMVPAAMVFVLARYGWRGAAAVLSAALLTWGAIALPFFIGGGGGVLRAYTGSVGQFPRLEMSAMNGWYLFDRLGVHVFHVSGGFAVRDTRAFWHGVTYRQFGMLLLGAYLLFLLAALRRRPTGDNLVLVCAMSVFAFFMLPTEMHERYLLPAVPLLALIADGTPFARRLFNGLSVTVLVNQALAMIFNRGQVQDAVMRCEGWLTHNASLDQGIALLNIGLFGWATWWVWRENFRPPVGERSGSEWG